jgi:gp6-like head-tail connector protein
MYVSVSELKDRLGITDTDRDFALDRAIEAASRWIDLKLGTRFYTTPAAPEVRYYTLSDCGWEVAVDDLLGLTELATDANGDGVYETIWTLNTDYRLGPPNAQYKNQPYRKLEKVWWTGRFSFPSYDRAIRVTSEQFGFCAIADVPPGIRELALLVAEQNAFNVLDVTMPGAQTYKLGAELTVTMATRDLPKLAQDILQEFRPTGGFLA